MRTPARAYVNADDAWGDLNAALQDVTPPCDGRALFTADRLTDGQRAACASICAACPVADLCNTYAVAAKVDFGFLGGTALLPEEA